MSGVSNQCQRIAAGHSVAKDVMSTNAYELPLDERSGTVEKSQVRKRHRFTELISQSQLNLQSDGKKCAQPRIPSLENALALARGGLLG